MTAINKAVALQFIDAMSKADRDLAEPCLAADAHTISKGFGRFAGIRSRAVMLGTIDAFTELVPGGLQLKVERVTEGDDRVIVECEGAAVTRDGEAYCNQYCFIFTMRDNLIARVDEYFCSVLADRVLWPLINEHDDGSLSVSN